MPEGFHGARSESPHGWRGGEGGRAGVPRKAHAGGHVSTRPFIAYQLTSGRCGQMPAEMATVRSGNVWARRAVARQEPTRHWRSGCTVTVSGTVSRGASGVRGCPPHSVAAVSAA